MNSSHESAAAEAAPSPKQRLLLFVSVTMSFGLLAFFGWLAWVALAAR